MDLTSNNAYSGLCISRKLEKYKEDIIDLAFGTRVECLLYYGKPVTVHRRVRSTLSPNLSFVDRSGEKTTIS